MPKATALPDAKYEKVNKREFIKKFIISRRKL